MNDGSMSHQTTVDDPVSVGVRLAVERLERHGLPKPDSDEFLNAIRVARGLLEGRRAPARAVELFIEHVAIAGAMREHYDETQLLPADIAHYFDLAVWFFNSFWHE